MKLSQKLMLQAEEEWKEAAGKPFLKEMALGTLPAEKYRSYMLQDYLYLHDYIGILEQTREYTDDPAVLNFLDCSIEDTRRELFRVHIPSMKELGISEDEMRSCTRSPEFRDYVEYMRQQLYSGGLLAGLTALLQCSWVYAFLAGSMMERYRDEILKSPYRGWFEAYGCSEYVQANQNWIDVLDKSAKDTGEEESRRLGEIFRKCSWYENRIWDALVR